jgi:hypothetical protein
MIHVNALGVDRFADPVNIQMAKDPTAAERQRRRRARLKAQGRKPGSNAPFYGTPADLIEAMDNLDQHHPKLKAIIEKAVTDPEWLANKAQQAAEMEAYRARRAAEQEALWASLSPEEQQRRLSGEPPRNKDVEESLAILRAKGFETPKYDKEAWLRRQALKRDYEDDDEDED